MDEEGFGNITKLVSKAHLDSDAGGSDAGSNMDGNGISGLGSESRRGDSSGEGGIGDRGIGDRGRGAQVSQQAAQHSSNQGPHVSFGDLERLNGGIIALTGGADGPLDCLLDEGHGEAAKARLDRLKAVFGDRLYVELQRH
ncbi:MAG: PHP domain-containing protein, partial [Nitratireductor sp.]|nr:PHP domain-containing protein [Nitratireductor sp.]